MYELKFKFKFKIQWKFNDNAMAIDSRRDPTHRFIRLNESWKLPQVVFWMCPLDILISVPNVAIQANIELTNFLANHLPQDLVRPFILGPF